MGTQVDRTFCQSRILRLAAALSFAALIVAVTWLMAHDGSPLRQYFYARRMEVPSWFSVVNAPPLVFLPALFTILLGGFENPRAEVLYPLGLLIQWTALGSAVLAIGCRCKRAR